ncbi:DUF6629 family protein [Polaromonas sp.]|uniref:DUF6629 family protein n=1 Tax=Polaromonas sp. TaxID=1869339 RepID=UPI0017AC3710|nr:DUF6629 family protein [Polaromonas sp.]NMM06333.1 hypothetical protein [Polaromonas sp.]
MCFSATASFVAGTVLVVLGVATLRATRRRAEIPFAAIPLLFGLQQLVEGTLWLSFSFDAPQLNVAMTYLFSMFSHVLWPMFVPFSIGLLEAVPWRRKAIWGFQGIGLLVGLYLLYMIIEFPVASVAAANIVYVSPHFYKIPVMLLYLAATCIGCFFSSIVTIRFFGVFALFLFGIAYGFFAVALFSVWCFFAAVLSSIIYIHFRFSRTWPARRLNGAI